MLNALGGREFSETQTFFQNYLRSPNTSSDLRVAAIEALSETKGDPTAFLVSVASDVDSDVRASAAWVLSATEVTGNAGGQLLGLLQSEQVLIEGAAAWQGCQFVVVSERVRVLDDSDGED